MGSTSCHVGNTYKDVLPPGLAYCGSGHNMAKLFPLWSETTRVRPFP